MVWSCLTTHEITIFICEMESQKLSLIILGIIVLQILGTTGLRHWTRTGKITLQVHCRPHKLNW